MSQPLADTPEKARTVMVVRFSNKARDLLSQYGMQIINIGTYHKDSEISYGLTVSERPYSEHRETFTIKVCQHEYDNPTDDAIDRLVKDFEMQAKQKFESSAKGN